MKTILTAAALAALVFSSAALAMPTDFNANGPGGSVWADGRVIGQSSDPGERANILDRYLHENTTD